MQVVEEKDCLGMRPDDRHEDVIADTAAWSAYRAACERKASDAELFSLHWAWRAARKRREENKESIGAWTAQWRAANGNP